MRQRRPAPPNAASLTGEEQQAVAEVVSMYLKGWFPMGQGTGLPVEWVQPTERAVLPLEPGAFAVSKSLAQRVRSGRFTITSDKAFDDCLHACAAPRRIEGETVVETWLADEIIDIYRLLHRAGLAHSVEAWLPPRDPSSPPVLVGGLYGLALGGAFCGESMFSRPALGGTDASKVALVHLVGHLRNRGFSLLDTQLANAHVAQFGMVEIPRAAYLEKLRHAASLAATWGTLDPKVTGSAVPEAIARTLRP